MTLRSNLRKGEQGSGERRQGSAKPPSRVECRPPPRNTGQCQAIAGNAKQEPVHHSHVENRTRDGQSWVTSIQPLRDVNLATNPGPTRSYLKSAESESLSNTRFTSALKKAATWGFRTRNKFSSLYWFAGPV